MDLHVLISSLIVFSVIRRLFHLISVRVYVAYMERLNSLSLEKVNSKYKHIFDFNYQHCQQYLVYPVHVYYKNYKTTRLQHVYERPLQSFCASEMNSSQMAIKNEINTNENSQISDFEQTEASVSYKINEDFSTTNKVYKSDLIISDVDIGTSTEYQEANSKEFKTFCNFDQKMDGQPTSSKRKNGPMWHQVSHNQMWKVETTLPQYQNHLQIEDSHSELDFCQEWSEEAVNFQHKQKMKKLRKNRLSSSKSKIFSAQNFITRISKLRKPICEEVTHFKNPTDIDPVNTTKGNASKNNKSLMRSLKIYLKTAFNCFKSKSKHKIQPITEEINYVPKSSNKQSTADHHKMAQIQKSTSSNRHTKLNHGRINKKRRNVVASKNISQDFIQRMNPNPNLTDQGFCVSIPLAALEETTNSINKQNLNKIQHADTKALEKQPIVNQKSNLMGTRNTKPTKLYPYPLSNYPNSQIVAFNNIRSSNFPTINSNSESFTIIKGKNLCDLSKVLNKHINTTDDTLILLAKKLKHKLKLLNTNSNILNEPGLKIAKDKKGNKRVILDIINLEALGKSHKVTKRLLDKSNLGQPGVSKVWAGYKSRKKRYLDEVRSVNLPLPKSNLLNYKRQTVSEVLQARIGNNKNVLFEEPELEIPWAEWTDRNISSEDEEFESLSIITPSSSTEWTKIENDSSKDVKSESPRQIKSNTLTELDSSLAYGVDVSDWEPLKISNNSSRTGKIKEPSHYLHESVLRPLSSELSLPLLKVSSSDSIIQPSQKTYPPRDPQPSLKRTISLETQEQLPDNMWWKPKRHEEVRVAPPEEEKSAKTDDDIDETLQQIEKKLAIQYEILLPLSDELKSQWDMLDDTEKLKFMERQRYRVALTPEEEEKSDKLIEELKLKTMGEEITVKGLDGKFKRWAGEGEGPSAEEEHSTGVTGKSVTWLDPREENWDKFVEDLKRHASEKLAKEGKEQTPQKEEKLLKMVEKYKDRSIKLTSKEEKKWDKFAKELKAKFAETSITPKEEEKLVKLTEELKIKVIANSRSKNKGISHKHDPLLEMIEKLELIANKKSKRKGPPAPDEQEMWQTLIQVLKIKQKEESKRKGQENLVKEEKIIKLIENLETKSSQKPTKKDKTTEKQWDILLKELEAKIKDEEEEEEEEQEEEEEEEEEKVASGGVFQRLKSKLKLLLNAKKRDMHTSWSNTSAESVMSDISVCACSDSFTESEIATILNTACENIKLPKEGGKVSRHIYSKEKELKKCACIDSYTELETGSGFGDFADSQTFDDQRPSAECVCGGSYSIPKIEKPTIRRPRKNVSSFGRLDNFRIATADIAQSTNAITGSKPSIHKDKSVESFEGGIPKESSVNSNSTTSEEKITKRCHSGSCENISVEKPPLSSAAGATVDTTQSTELSDLEKTCSCTQTVKRSILCNFKSLRKTGSRKSTIDTTQSSKSGLKLSINKKKFGPFKSRNLFRAKDDTFDTTISDIKSSTSKDKSSRSFKRSRIPKKIQGKTNMAPRSIIDTKPSTSTDKSSRSPTGSSPNQSKFGKPYAASDSRGPIASKARTTGLKLWSEKDKDQPSEGKSPRTPDQAKPSVTSNSSRSIKSALKNMNSITQKEPVSVRIKFVESEMDVSAESVQSSESVYAGQNEESYGGNQPSGSVESIGQNEEPTRSFKTVTELQDVQPSGSAESINQNVEISSSIELMVTEMEVETFILDSSASKESTTVIEEEVIEPCTFSCSTADLSTEDDLCSIGTEYLCKCRGRTVSEEEIEALFKRYIHLNDEPAESLPLIRSSKSIRSNIVIDKSMPLTPEQEEAEKKLKSFFV